MKSQQNKFTLRLSVIAVQSAMVAMAMGPIAARAEEPSVLELTTPANTVQAGIGYVSDKSAKFGEYNGLSRHGATADLSFDLRTNGDNAADATRFRATGNNLGLETRDLTLEYGEQGKYRLRLGYDELRRNISDTFQTPYLGAGTNLLTLPSTWIKPVQANVNVAGGVAAPYNANALSPAWIANDTVYRFNNAANNNTGGPQQAYAATLAQQAAMLATANVDNGLIHNVDLYLKRTKANVSADFIFNNQWSISASAGQEHKVGLKAKSYINSNEAALTVPDPINEDHHQYNLAINFHNDNAFLTGAYYASFYRNNINGVTVEEITTHNLGTNGVMGTTATAPSNDFHQFTLTGGYTFSPATKLVGDVGYSRNTQDQDYLTNSLPTRVAPAALGGTWLPTNNLNGLVITKSLDLKLTHKATSDLNLGAAYKYSDRNNQTPVKTYIFQDLESTTAGNSPYNTPLGLPANTIGAGNNGGILANRAFSKKVNQLNLDADYRVVKGQTVKLGYEWQKVERYCDGSWIDCASADSTKEQTLRADWLFKAVEDLSGRVGYAYSQRRAGNYNTNSWLALAPMANVVPDQAVLNTGGYSAYQTMQMFGLTAWGPQTAYPATAPLGTVMPALTAAQWGTILNIPAASISANQLLALNAYFANGNKLSGTNVATRNFLSMMPGQETPIDGDRNRDKLRGSLNWQATEKFSLGGGVDYNRDEYNNTVAGLMDGKTLTLNLDGAYQVSDDFSTGFYVTHEDRKTKIAGPGTGTNADGSAAATGTIANTAAGSLVGNTCNTYTSNAQELQNARIDPCLNWVSNTKDKINTLGLNLRHKGLLGGKLDLTGNAGYTKAVTSQSFASGGAYVSTLLSTTNFVNAAGGATTWSRTWVPAADMPDVSSRIITLSVVGKYALDKSSAIRLGYTYQNLKYDDWYYANNTAGALPASSAPSNQPAPTYTVHAVGAAYIYTFR